MVGGGGGGPGQGDQWQGQLQHQQHHGFDHPGLQHQHLQHLQQQQQQHQMMLQGHQNLSPLVGQQISQLSSMFPPGSGQHQTASNLNMMLFPGGPIQSPPSTNNYLVLGTTAAPGLQRPGDSINIPASLSPNSTPGLQMPAPSATPPIVNINIEERNQLFLNGMGRVMGQHHGMDKMGLEGQISEADPAMIWKGMQGGILAEMFPAVHHNTSSAAAAVAAQMHSASVAHENLLRLQQHQQQHQAQAGQHKAVAGGHQYHPAPPPGPHMISQADMARMFPPSHGFVQAAQSPPPSGSFVLPPGPRPRPVGGDDTSPGYTPDIPLCQTAEKEDLVIGSWNEECEKDSSALLGNVQLHDTGGHHVPAHLGGFHHLNQPPPRRVQESVDFCGTFTNQRGRADVFRRGGGWTGDTNRGRGRAAPSFNGGVGGVGGAPRGGRGGLVQRSRGRAGSLGGRGRSVDHNQEKAAGKNAAIEETKALLAKMRLEDKEIMDKYKKDKGTAETEDEEAEGPGLEPGGYKPRDRRDRGRGRGRAGGVVPHHRFHVPGLGPIPNIAGDFRTPPFPGLEGFFPLQNVYFPPGFPHGILPGSFPAPALRGRGFPRGFRGGFPAGFPIRGIPPHLLTNRGRGRGQFQGGRGGRGGRGGHQTSGLTEESHEESDKEENPLLTAIESNNPEETEIAPECEDSEPPEETEKED